MKIIPTILAVVCALALASCLQPPTPEQQATITRIRHDGKTILVAGAESLGAALGNAAVNALQNAAAGKNR